MLNERYGAVVRSLASVSPDDSLYDFISIDLL